MKAIILTAGAIVLGVNTNFAQKMKEAEVPKAVVTSFNTIYKDAKCDKWEKEGDRYEAEFKWEKKKRSATFSPSGKLEEAEYEIKESELPKGVDEYVSKNYDGYKICEASIVEDADTKKISYEAEIKKGDDHMDLLFDTNGNFLKKKMHEHDHKKDDKKDDKK